MAIKIGVVGAGAFSQSFVPLFQAHPWVNEVTLAELVPERRQDYAGRFKLKKVFATFEALLKSDVDAVALFTQRHLHSSQVLAALDAGKHVYSAVPMASSQEDIEAILEKLKSTGLIYMSGETSYYYPSTLYCRQQFKEGKFGEFVYGEAQYLHDMTHGFYDAFQNSGGKDWRKVAGYPPMLYPTHSVSMILSVTGARATQVACLGYVDKSEDEVFTKKNLWQNTFSNQSALLRTSDDGMCRINEFRRVGWGGKNCVYMSMFGTEGSYEEHAGGMVWASLEQGRVTNLEDTLDCKGSVVASHYKGTGVQDDFESGVAKIHPVGRLPATFNGMPNGHFGSHQFLADDFVKAIYLNKLPPLHAWEAAKYTLPGIIAHTSSLKNGEMLTIPDVGDAPSHWDGLSEQELMTAAI